MSWKYLAYHLSFCLGRTHVVYVLFLPSLPRFLPFLDWQAMREMGCGIELAVIEKWKYIFSIRMWSLCLIVLLLCRHIQQQNAPIGKPSTSHFAPDNSANMQGSHQSLSHSLWIHLVLFLYFYCVLHCCTWASASIDWVTLGTPALSMT
jgi:hypothetical protein